MARMAIIGDAVSVAGFRPLGLATFPCERPADARKYWKEIARGEYAVVFVTEPVYEAIVDLTVEVADVPTPAVTVIPGLGSAGGVGAPPPTHARRWGTRFSSPCAACAAR